MITDEPPMQRIWSCLRAILCDAGSAQDNCFDLVFDIPAALDYLTPLSGIKTIPDDLAGFEKTIKTLEDYAAAGESSLSSVYRYTRLIRGALDEMKKATQND